MKPIIAPITPTSAPDEISNLQDAILFILQLPLLALSEGDRAALAAAVEQERPRAEFGRRTTKALNVVQDNLHIPQTTQVDEGTAETFNRLLRTAGAFEDAANRSFIVSGRVRGADGVPLAGLEVRAFHEADAVAIRLGEDASDAEGRYTIRYELLPHAPTLLLRVAATRSGVPVAASDIVRGPKPIEAVDLTAALTTTPGPKRRIEGRVVFEHGLPAEGLKLRLLQHVFGQDTPVAISDVTTGEQGLYQIAYDADPKSSSLQISAVDAGGAEVKLTDILHGLGGEEVAYLNLAAPESLRPLGSEFARMTTDFTPHVADMKALAGARENNDRQDITLLNAATGWDARLIALASTAARVSAEPNVGLSQPVLYGLFRTGLPSDTLQLAHVSAETVGHALDKVQRAGIAELSAQDVSDAKTAFGKLQQNVRLSVAVPGSQSTYDALLTAADLSVGARDTFADVFLNHSGPSDELWSKAAAAGVGKDDIQKLQQQGKLTFVTRSEAMTTHLQKSMAVTDPIQLVEKGLYQATKWKAEAQAVAAGDAAKLKALIPPGYAADTVDQSLDLYTEDMARKVRVSYPTQVVAHQIEQDPADLFQLGAIKGETATLLKDAAAKGFKLGQTPVDAFLRRNGDVLERVSKEAVAPATSAVKTLQRIYQMTPSDAAMPVLLSLGFTSAFDVVALSQDEFLQRHADAFRSIEEATLIYRKAQQISSVTHNLFTIARKLQSDPPLYGLSGPTAVRETVKQELIKQFPTLESLFGSMDYGECEHCRSVLSPAAYMVDLLQFIDSDRAVWNSFLSDWKKRRGGEDYAARYKKPYEALIERRPDLPHIALTCENTHTALPYIDIVNEILEYYVAHGALAEKAANNTRDESTAELLAEPQNVITDAYEKLERATYPLELPFDLWLDTVRSFARYFEVPLAQILEVFRPGDELFMAERSYDRAAIAFESLGLSPAESAIFTDPDPLDAWHELYGFQSQAAALTPAVDEATGQRIDLNAAKALSRRLGVTYKELVRILQTGFVNPDLAGFVTLSQLRASVHDVLFYSLNKEMYDANKDLLGADRATLSAPDQARFDALKSAQIEAMTEIAGFEQRLMALTDEYKPWGFDASAWLNDALTRKTFDNVLVLSDPQASVDFDRATLVYGFRQAENERPADGAAFVRINLFVRLWRKLGWTIEETDRALRLFIPKDEPFDGATLAKRPLKSALISLARFKALDERLAIGKQSRLRLLALWSPIATDGIRPLYAQLFLQPGRDAVFNDPLGRYLSAESIKAAAEARTHRVLLEDVPPSDKIDQAALSGHPRARVTYDPQQQVQQLEYDGILTDAEKAILAALSASPAWPTLLEDVQLRAMELGLIKRHMPALQGALSVSAEEIASILTAEGQSSDAAPLSLDNVSLLFRYGLLARALQMSVGQLIALKRLSGLNPFHPLHPTSIEKLDEDHLYSQTLRFVELAAEVKDSGFEVSDLDYLVRHRFDATGKYRPNLAVTSALLKGLADGIDAILREHALPEQQDAVTDDMLRQKLGLALPADVVDRTVRMLDGTASAEARTLFDSFLRKQKIKVDGDAGALDEADFVELFAALKQREQIAPGDTPLQIKDKEKANDKIAEENAATLQGRRYRLAAAFLPIVRQRLIKELVVQTLTTHLAADRPLVEALVTDGTVLHLGNGSEPLLDAVADVGVRGLTVRFYNVDDATGAPDAGPRPVEDARTGLTRAGQPLRPAAARSARISGYLEVPTTGAYRMYVACGSAGQEAELRITDRPDWLLTGIATVAALEIDEYVQLEAGRQYEFSLTLRKLGGHDATLLVQGETLPKGALARLALYPEGSLTRAGEALTILSKTVLLLQTLNLREREVRYFVTHAVDFAGLSLSHLPTSETDDGRVLFDQVLRLVGYSRLKRDLARGTDGLIDLFETTTESAAHEAVAGFSRRDRATVKAVVRAVLPPLPVKDERPLRRLSDALSIVERLGVPVGALVSLTRIVNGAATANERATIAADLKEAIKARFDVETWQRVAQPIFDPLRQRKRDALVAHVMHQHGFARLEQVYEYFLVDPGMEPVVQTSRIRLATSSVQLFIQRSLLNLERFVHPSAINGQQWEWMKAYRVWEANRKIFLFPENWLEPEFRDDKTHLFRELEGSLLQGDVSNDLVEDALLKYLRTLNELARLEIIAMHLEDLPDAALNRLHVIGRTHGEPHKYFYRRYAHQMWTPWEPIAADISGDHLAPVVWRDRLFLFWATFMEVPTRSEPPAAAGGVQIDTFNSRIGSAPGSSIKSVRNGAGGDEPTFSEITLSQLSNGVQSAQGSFVDVQVQLHWSEYVKGEWSTRESGGIGASFVGTVPFGFTPQSVSVHVSKDRDGEEDRAVYIHLGGPIRRAFKLAGRNSAPESVGAGTAPLNPYTAKEVRGTRFGGTGALSVTLTRRITVTNGKAAPSIEVLPVLASAALFTVLPCDNDIGFATPEIASLIKPVFYQDNSHAYYVEPNLIEHTIEEWKDWVVRTPQPDVGSSLSNWPDPIRQVPELPNIKKPIIIDPTNPVWKRAIDNGDLFRVKPAQDWIVNPSTGMVFDGSVIGATGRSPGLSLVTSADVAAAVERGATPVAVQPGTELPSDASVFYLGPRAAVDGAPANGITLVGSGGFNQVLEQNVSRLNLLASPRSTLLGAGRIIR